MLALFQYNWQIRNEWFKWCEQVSTEELLRKRVGGVGGILETLYHIVEVEYSWIRDLQAKPAFAGTFHDYATLDQVRYLSTTFQAEVEKFLQTWSNEMENWILILQEKDGTFRKFTFGEVLRHVIVHEIHHIGQLSIWARELGIKPVSPNFIGRGLGR